MGSSAASAGASGGVGSRRAIAGIAVGLELMRMQMDGRSWCRCTGGCCCKTAHHAHVEHLRMSMGLKHLLLDLRRHLAKVKVQHGQSLQADVHIHIRSDGDVVVAIAIAIAMIAVRVIRIHIRARGNVVIGLGLDVVVDSDRPAAAASLCLSLECILIVADSM